MSAEERLAEIAGRADAATPGVWKLWGMSVMADQDGTSNVDTAVDVARTLYRDDAGKPRTWDAEFIAHARQDVPRLVAALRAVLDVADEWRMAEDYATRVGAPASDLALRANQIVRAIEEALDAH